MGRFNRVLITRVYVGIGPVITRFFVREAKRSGALLRSYKRDITMPPSAEPPPV